MSKTALCESETPYQGSYLELAIFLPILTILQFALLYHTILNEFIKNQTKNRTQRILKILFLSLQLIFIIILILDSFRWIIDPYSLILRDNISCDMLAISPKVLIPLYYEMYCLFIIIRLYSSFKGSFYDIGRQTLVIFCSSMILVIFVFAILMILWRRPPCIMIWTPWDVNVSFAFCSFISDKKVRILVSVGIVTVLMANIIVGSIFVYKLRYLLNLNGKNAFDCPQKKHKISKMKLMIIKLNILTITALIFTTFSWVCWVLTPHMQIGTVLIFMDVFINNVCVGLMFSSNDKYYRKLCKVCITFCLLKLDQGYDHAKKEEVQDRQRHVSKYLSVGEDNIDVSG
eukprot:462959_1